jgi:hypothetical protein
MRRLALIAVGIAVAALLLLPAASAWLRQPAASPLPDPVNLQSAADWEQRHPRASDRRVRSKLVERSRSPEKTASRRLPGRDGARLVALMPASARTAAAVEGNDDSSDFDRAVHAVPDDDDDGDELGDG